MNIQDAELGDDERLVVRPKMACYLLSIGITRLYELLNSGELESYKDGAARLVTMRSIRGYVDRQVTAVGAEVGP